jgi:hypothetical protein
MGYVGNEPSVNFTSFAKQDITGDGGASYTLTHAVANANEIEVFVNNVRQEPTSAYSVSGTTLTMTGNVASTDDFYVIYLGKALQTTVPPDGSVTTAKIVDDAVTSAKLDTNIAIDGDLTVDTSTLKVDSTNNRVGIGTSSPADVPLSVFSGGSGTNGQLKLGYDGSNYWQIGRLDPAGTGSGNFQFKPNGGTSVLDVDTSGNVDVKSSGDATLKVTAGGTSNDSKIDFVHGTTTDGGITFDHNGSYASEVMSFRTGNNTTHMYLTGYGTVGINKASPTAQLHVKSPNMANTRDALRCQNGTNNTGGYFIRFTNSSDSVCGYVEQTGTAAVAYRTSSDHRLKENVVTMTGAIDRVKQLLPKRFNFIDDGTDTVVDGFLAHEAQTVVPEAVGGTHNEVDEDGNPVYQGIDQAKLVPLLTGALKEAIEKIESLEARITALENS